MSLGVYCKYGNAHLNITPHLNIAPRDGQVDEIGETLQELFQHVESRGGSAHLQNE